MAYVNSDKYFSKYSVLTKDFMVLRVCLALVVFVVHPIRDAKPTWGDTGEVLDQNTS